MINTILKALEDPNRPLLGPNVRGLKLWGLLLPKNFFFKWFYIFTHTYITIFIMTAFIDVWFIKNDLMPFLENMKTTVLATISVFKMIMFISKNKGWVSVIEYVTRADIELRKSSNPRDKAIVEKYTKYSRRITYFYTPLMFTTVFTLILPPLVKYFASPTYRNNVKNGTESYVQVLSGWAPFDKNYLPLYVPLSIYYTLVAIEGSGYIASFDTAVITIMTFFKGELELLRLHSAEIFKTTNVSLSDEEASVNIKKCHKRHVVLIEHAQIFNSCLSPIMFIYMLVCSIGLCVTAYQITVQTSTAERFLTFEYLLFNIAQLFLFCWHANEVFHASTCLMHGPYEGGWWTRSKKIKKQVFILTEQFKTLIIFTAGPFTDLTVATFINIMKGAYSYYTLLSNSQV